MFSYLASTGVIFGLTDFGDFQIYRNFFYESTNDSGYLFKYTKDFGNIFTFLASFFSKYISNNATAFFFSLSFLSLYIKTSFIYYRLKRSSISYVSSFIYITMIAVFFENIRIRASLSISLAIICFLLASYVYTLIQSSSMKLRNLIATIALSLLFIFSSSIVIDVNITGLLFLAFLFADQFISISLPYKDIFVRMNFKSLLFVTFLTSCSAFIVAFFSKNILLSLSFLSDTALSPYLFKLVDNYIPKYLLLFVIFIFLIRSLSLSALFFGNKSSRLPISFILMPVALGIALVTNQYLFYATLECSFFYMLIDANIWYRNDSRNLLLLFSSFYFVIRIMPLLIKSI